MSKSDKWFIVIVILLLLALYFQPAQAQIPFQADVTHITVYHEGDVVIDDDNPAKLFVDSRYAVVQDEWGADTVHLGEMYYEYSKNLIMVVSDSCWRITPKEPSITLFFYFEMREESRIFMRYVVRNRTKFGEVIAIWTP